MLFVLALIHFLFCASRYSTYMNNRDLNSTMEKPLPVPQWHFFNTNKHYTLVYLLGWLVSVIECTYSLITITLFLTLMIFVLSQISELHIIARDIDFYSGLLQKSQLQILFLLVSKHQKIIKYVDELNKSMRQILLVEFLLNSINIASVTVVILVYEMPIVYLLFNINFVALLVVQLFFLSWHANEIEIQSLLLCESLYVSEWYNFEPEANKIINIMMIRSLSPLNIYIGIFYPMTLATALTTMKTAYSYVTMIVSFTDN
ncbi:hypothetical protein GWI33_017171 [Rhynchophorus ferrugineus]|uniref:Odorant receptor n=1 Tax=Rhynchophorus ferrugineus TaxID=354439 RepID=A0A834I9R1_RHYFE|nr:hypothetical protein GWI33_017171 [Rhynchophorus ferrugineus]